MLFHVHGKRFLVGWTRLNWNVEYDVNSINSVAELFAVWCRVAGKYFVYRGDSITHTVNGRGYGDLLVLQRKHTPLLNYVYTFIHQLERLRVISRNKLLLRIKVNCLHVQFVSSLY